jgi:hypothetical protein
LFFHFYPKPSGFVLKENGTIPFYATFLKKVFGREFHELTRITKKESGKAAPSLPAAQNAFRLAGIAI